MLQEIQSNDENVYYNVVFEHDDSQGSDPQPFFYNVQKTLPIISKCDDYFVSITRFAIPLNQIPKLICPIVPDSGTSQRTPLRIGISVGGVDSSQSVFYVPDNSLPAVNQNNTNGQIITPYYYIYSYELLLSLINTALQAAFSASSSPGGGNSPFFYYDPNSGLISLVVSAAFVAAGATIFANSDTLKYLSGFRTTFVTFDTADGHEYEFVLSTLSNYDFYFSTEYPTAATYLKFTQEYSTVAQWTSFRSLLLTTNTIPVSNEYIPINGTQNSVSSSIPIISDFIPDIENPGDLSTIAIYNPTAQYRLVNLIKSTPLQSIDLQIYWQDTSQNIYPLMVGVGQSVSVKIGFFKKSLYQDTKDSIYKKGEIKGEGSWDSGPIQYLPPRPMLSGRALQAPSTRLDLTHRASRTGMSRKSRFV
jgi:hypothetical protein